MIIYHGECRTPKEMAAILIREKLEELPNDWRPANLPGQGLTTSEYASVLTQIRRYQERFYKILSVMDGDEPPAQSGLGAAGEVLRDILEPRS